MSASQFDDIKKTIDKHLEKTGVVLVGMHQELQEQKHRIGQYHEQVNAVTNEMTRRQDEIVADLRSRAEAATSVLGEVGPVVQRIRAVAQDADNAITAAGVALQTSTNNLSRSYADFRVETGELIGSIKEQVATFSSESTKLLKHFSDQQAQSISASSNENRAALQAIVAAQKEILTNAQNAFSESIAKLEEKLSTHMDAHKRFLRSSYDELSARQGASDNAFAALKAETERNQAQQLAFIKRTRIISGALVVAGFVVVGALLYGKGVLL